MLISDLPFCKRKRTPCKCPGVFVSAFGFVVEWKPLWAIVDPYWTFRITVIVYIWFFVWIYKFYTRYNVISLADFAIHILKVVFCQFSCFLRSSCCSIDEFYFQWVFPVSIRETTSLSGDDLFYMKEPVIAGSAKNSKVSNPTINIC